MSKVSFHTLVTPSRFSFFYEKQHSLSSAFVTPSVEYSNIMKVYHFNIDLDETASNMKAAIWKYLTDHKAASQNKTLIKYKNTVCYTKQTK